MKAVQIMVIYRTLCKYVVKTVVKHSSTNSARYKIILFINTTLFVCSSWDLMKETEKIPFHK